MAILVLGMIGGLLAGCHAQNAPKDTGSKIVRRIKIQHADPALIALLLKGHQVYTLTPEISTIQKTKR